MVCGLLSACFPAPASEAVAMETTLKAVPSPHGWFQTRPVEVACRPDQRGCDDDSALRVFETGSGLDAACSSMVTWLEQNPQTFLDPLAIAGNDTRAPEAVDCRTEVQSHEAYLVYAGATGPGLPRGARYALRLTRATLDAGWHLSVVIGNPPQDPWRGP